MGGFYQIVRGASTLFSMAERRDFVGERYDARAALLDLFAPMSVVDMYEQYAHNGVARTILTAPLTVVGVRASTYDRKAYENAVNPFLEALGEYESIEEDDGLDEPERERLLANIRATNPLMRDGVREDVAAAVRQICKSEARARRAEKAGLEPDSALLSEIARGKSELLEKIRAERWK